MKIIKFVRDFKTDGYTIEQDEEKYTITLFLRDVAQLAILIPIMEGEQE